MPVPDDVGGPGRPAARGCLGQPGEAAQARDVTDVLRIQGNYLRRQGERSMEQAREIGEMILRFGRDAVTPPKSGD